MQYQTAKKCKDNKTCDECEKEFAFIEKGCVSYDIIPNNKFVDSCDEYNSNYLCIRCKDDCLLKGKKCKCSHELKIVLTIGICLGFNICSKCKKEKALYFLSCGCLICEKDIGKLKLFKNGDNLKCDCCNKLIENVTIIQNKCKLCSGTKNLRYLNNKIAFEICSDCYAKYIKNNKIELTEHFNTSNQTTIETN